MLFENIQQLSAFTFTFW